MAAFTGLDSIGLYLSGGSTNYSPADALGGVISTKLIQGMSVIFASSVHALVVEDATPENLEGNASIVMASGKATYTPPDGLAGSAVTVAAGQRAILTGSDATKAVRIYRESGKLFEGTSAFALTDMMNGVFAMSNVPNADRVAGTVVYRALFLKAFQDVEAILCWITTDGQSTYQLATEEPGSGDDIQTISDETTAPGGLVWENANAESTGIVVGDSNGDLLEDETYGLWVKRTFPPAGVVDAKENVSFNLQFVAG